MLPEQEFMEKIETLRVLYGKPLKVTSGARCPKYNAKVSSTGMTGPHTKGVAIDLAVSGHDAYRLITLALSMPDFTGLGVKQCGPHEKRFIHLDTLPNEPGQPRPWCWSYA